MTSIRELDPERDAEAVAEIIRAGDQQAARLSPERPTGRLPQSGNGFFAKAARTCDVTHTGVVTYFAE